MNMAGAVAVSALWLVLFSGTAGAQDVAACGTLTNAYGPYDYRRDKDKLWIVEKHHYAEGVESMTKRVTLLGGNLDYTLRAFPNHHRALLTMMKFGFREKTPRPPGTNFSVECYMIRAERFRPDDAMVKVIYGLYLMKTGQTNKAIQKLEAARALDLADPNVPYNLGLAYFELKQYDKALENAHRAYAGGFPLPGLRDKLKRAGKWREPGTKISGSAAAERRHDLAD